MADENPDDVLYQSVLEHHIHRDVHPCQIRRAYRHEPEDEELHCVILSAPDVDDHCQEAITEVGDAEEIGEKLGVLERDRYDVFAQQ